MADNNPFRRIRVVTFRKTHGIVWQAVYEPPGARACLGETETLPEMCEFLKSYFAHELRYKPIRVENRHMKFVTNTGEEYAR